MKSQMQLILGTMTFGEQIFGHDVENMIASFLAQGYTQIDTAYVYNDGRCEQLLGEALSGHTKSTYQIATKINPRITGKLDKEAVIFQLNESLNRLHLKQVKTLYLHFPDPNTPILSALEACAQLYTEGKFSELGLSNFPAWLVADVYHICRSHNWMLPKVYQGLYNPLSRNAERELNAALDYYGLRFYAYNPLAGGMLTNKYDGESRELKAGRFINRPNYQKRYWKDSYFQAVNHIKKACALYQIDIVEAAYRWMIHHSMLNAERNDAIIVGASSVSQLQENMQAATKPPLPIAVLTAIEEAWSICKSDAPEYFQFYVPKGERT